MTMLRLNRRVTGTNLWWTHPQEQRRFRGLVRRCGVRTPPRGARSLVLSHREEPATCRKSRLVRKEERLNREWLKNLRERTGEDKGAGDDLTMVLQSGTEGPVLRAFSRICPEIVTELQDDPPLRRRGGARERAGCGRNNENRQRHRSFHGVIQNGGS